MELRNIVKKEFIENDDTLCFKTTPLSKVITLSILSGSVYDVILYLNYWKTLKENFGYKISPFWRGLFLMFTNFKLFPLFNNYFSNFNTKLPIPVLLSIFCLLGYINIHIAVNGYDFNIGGYYIVNYGFKLNTSHHEVVASFKPLILGIPLSMFVLRVIKASIYALIQHKINKVNEEHYQNAPKNPWSVINIIWTVILGLIFLWITVFYIRFALS